MIAVDSDLTTIRLTRGDATAGLNNRLAFFCPYIDGATGKEELYEILTKQIDNEIKKLSLESYIEKETITTENETGVTVIKTIICRENIAYQEEIILGIVNWQILVNIV